MALLRVKDSIKDAQSSEKFEMSINRWALEICEGYDSPSIVQFVGKTCWTMQVGLMDGHENHTWDCTAYARDMRDRMFPRAISNQCPRHEK